ncbi:PucR family transcriptional regulator [Microbacterium hydrocarbonoxydans]|uniref:PucR family transcriptional regulator n=1 Tax=Microbacterium hydrocarbonoxydans TaxID=273678 RepID=UPI003D98CDB0
MTEEPSLRPGTTIGRILAEFGPAHLQAVCGPLDLTRRVESILIQDPEDELEARENALVLGIGLRTGAAMQTIIDGLAAHGSTGLVVRGPFEATPAVRTQAEKAAIEVFSLSPGASWGNLAAMLRTLMTPRNVDGSRGETFGGIIAGDLFAVANSVAALLKASVTIEDRHSRLLAFSSVREGADASRVQTILGRQVPAQYTRYLEEAGVFQAIYRASGSVTVAPLPEEAGAPPEEGGRVAIAVRAGDEILGTIWVASERLSVEQEQILLESSRLAAMHLVWQRTDADVERRRSAEIVASVLRGASGSEEAARRLGLRDESSVVLALKLSVPGSGHLTYADIATERRKLADAFATHLSFAHPRAASGLVEDVTYGIVPVAAADSGSIAVRLAEDFLDRVHSPLQALIGIGRVASGLGDLPRSRSQADRALKVLESSTLDRRVARFDDVYAEALLLELPADATELPSGPIARLAAYDREHQSSLVDTLRAWLDAFGDIAQAAAATFVHGNTFRYRLRRVTEVGGIDLDDPRERFSAMLQMQIIALAGGQAPSEHVHNLTGNQGKSN